MILIFWTFYNKTFYSDVCSLSFIFTFILSVFVILIPFFASNSTLHFWRSPWYYLDTPIVELTPYYQVYINEENDSNEFKTYFSSSFTNLKENFDDDELVDNTTVQIANIYDKEIEANKRIKFTFTFKSKTNNCENIRNVKMLLFFKYGLDSSVRLLMNSIGYIDIDTINGFSKINIKGDLKLQQKAPIEASRQPNTIYYYYDKEKEMKDLTDKEKKKNEEEEDGGEEKLLGADKMNENCPYDIISILDYYENNLYTTSYDYKYIVLDNTQDNNVCEVEAEIDIPKFERILYVPSLYELLKNAWIQYFFLFAVVYIIFRYIIEFLMEHKIFSCYEKGELIDPV